MLELITGCGLGFLLGLRHALEPDHLAAVSTLVTENPSPRRAAGLGAAWGLGHTAALFLVALVLAALHATISPRLADLFELLVAAMLVVLGGRAVYLAAAAARRGVRHVHRHGEGAHLHAGPRSHLHVGRWTLAVRPLLIGLCHGLAGSGALTALALARMPSLLTALAYVLLFGVGSLLGMTLLSLLAGWPLARLARSDRARRWLGLTAGGVACVIGLTWGWPMVGRLKLASPDNSASLRLGGSR